MAVPHRMAAAHSAARTHKVDRSAAYACRYLAKNVVAAGLADRCTLQISYVIGGRIRCRCMWTCRARAGMLTK